MGKDFETSFLADKDKVDFSKLDIFDRVINLKLYTSDSEGNEKDVYTIRSDFELYYPDLLSSINSSSISINNKICYVRKCQHKPSIKVRYKRTSLSESVNVDIFVSNFYMLDRNGQIISGFNNSTYRLSKVEFSMGYFGQFSDLFTRTFSKTTTITPSDLTTVGFGDNAGNGIMTMSMSNVEYSQLDKLPPDMVLHIHGYLGNTFAYPLEKDGKDTLSEYEEIKNGDTVIKATEDETFLETVFFECITRKWLKCGTPANNRTLKTTLAPYNDLKVDGVTGKMSASDALKYGIRVYLSKGAKEYSKNKVTSIFPKDAEGNLVLSSYSLLSADTAEGTMNLLENVLGLSGFSHTLIDTKGCYILFMKEELEDIERLVSDIKEPYADSVLKKSFNNHIPAVYNITTDAVCTIVCPFFCFIDPFEKVYFKSRYALGGIVSYFANFTNANRNEFYVLYQSVEFATVEDVNECSIVCTGGKTV